MIPLVHDLSDETVVVFSGGPVGVWETHRFAREARTVVTNSEFADHGLGDAERVRTTPAPGEVPGRVERFAPTLATAATDDDAVNDAVVTVAQNAGTLVNRADRNGEHDVESVIVPATVEDGDTSVTITTDDASSALSKYLRERVEAELEGAGETAALTAELHAELKASDRSSAERRGVIRAAV